MSGWRERWWVGLLAGLAVLAIACEGGAVGAPPSGGPDRTGSGGGILAMAALGDSVTDGFASCLAPVPCPRNSWSTGDGTRIDSHYRRLVRTNPGLKGRAYNLAVGNARADALAGQASAAVQHKPQYVTILIGANDACRSRIDDMTTVETFRRQVDQALAVLKQGAPQARVLVASIPDIRRLWDVGHTSPVAVKAWSFGVCPALLAGATSTAPADVARRQAFADRVDAYNTQLAAACKAYGPRCRDDGGAAHRVAFTLDMIAAQDFFHPNGAGQNALAKATWPGEPVW
ncbi:SGNH/GDSL hydrolase family protein [Dactylosporangium fulvum]|uniref:GDSL-type esterase/lipase family protein n=1 Tax=Dactylosporangium fulvum TaxID=53359 RepID=A0ABY5W4A9_9ACTN|nr:GDSL-type esterase/lipase family protein [Dactylosporangium fulvum]UWP84752.1 GDSL-type esterase/lipase family protein [Dactylosporangium fulvum]